MHGNSCCRSVVFWQLAGDDVKDMPMLGIAARRRGVGFLLLEHLELEHVEQGQCLFATDEGHARPPDPTVARAIPLAAEPAAGRQRLADALPYAAERLGLAKRQGKARIHQADADRQWHVLKPRHYRRDVAAGRKGTGLQLAKRLG